MKVIYMISMLLCALMLPVNDDSYFPIKKDAGAEGLTEYEAQWYSQSLERMKEPRLPESAKDVTAEVYRLLILPTWGNSIALRIQRKRNTYTLSARRLDGQAGYDPGRLLESRQVELSEADSKALESLVQAVNLFKMSTDNDTYGSDGDESVLEGVLNGKYHVVTRWCAISYRPEERGLTAFVALYRFLVDKSNLSEPPKNKGHRLI